MDPILLLSQILLSGTTVFFIAENIYLRNSSFYSKNTKQLEINSNFSKENTYKNLKLRNKFSILRNRSDRVSYTKHISYWKEK